MDLCNQPFHPKAEKGQCRQGGHQGHLHTQGEAVQCRDPKLLRAQNTPGLNSQGQLPTK